MKGNLKRIPKTTGSSIAGLDKYSIRKMLKEAGYTDKEIKKILEEDRILIAPQSLHKGLNGEDNLYILEKEKPIEDRYIPLDIDRFRDLDIE